MKINGIPYRTIWPTADGAVEIIDQTQLPHEFVTLRLGTMRDAEYAIREMQVRGAPLIGVTAAYGVALSMRHHASDAALQASCDMLLKARPTAVNLRCGTDARRFISVACRSARRGRLDRGVEHRRAGRSNQPGDRTARAGNHPRHSTTQRECC
jgi:methylthioribose-1-phosphate isomerase